MSATVASSPSIESDSLRQKSKSTSNTSSASMQPLSTGSMMNSANVAQKSSNTIKPDCPVCQDPTQQPRVFVKLFLHSLAMFTLPFVSYFFAKRVVMEEFDMTVQQGYIYGAVAAVITVNVVIGSYVYQALTEDSYHDKLHEHKD